jgi:glucose-6-phosphate 1-dehydrogenase
MTEEAVFRVDHFLAMTTVQNMLGSRLANRVLEPIWNGTHIAEVDIVWEESLALEGRAGYYDGVGALKDMIQNHLLQLLCLVAMEPPVSLGERDLRDRKLDVLRSVRPLTADDVRHRTRRARYTTARSPATPMSRTWTPATGQRRSPRSSCNWTTGAGRERPSGSARPKRSAVTAKRWRSGSGRCPTCRCRPR